MNKLSLPGRVWVASDMHLGPHTPQTNRAFQNFLSQAAAQADALILGGDIFNVWIGDDLIHAPPQWLARLLAALQQLAQSTPLYLCPGNRDFLMGDTLCRHVHAHLMDEQTVLETDAGQILFSHGDEYCTDDRSYQRFRYWVRKKWVQRIFLAFSIEQRQRWASHARQRSMQANQHKTTDIMDVNDKAVRDAFERSQTNTMVHGHTHRPAIHKLQGPKGELTRVVLPDWDCEAQPPRGGWLEISAAGLAQKSLYD